LMRAPVISRALKTTPQVCIFMDRPFVSFIFKKNRKSLLSFSYLIHCLSFVFRLTKHSLHFTFDLSPPSLLRRRLILIPRVTLLPNCNSLIQHR
jgi:hypothetical protein